MPAPALILLGLAAAAALLSSKSPGGAAEKPPEAKVSGLPDGFDPKWFERRSDGVYALKEACRPLLYAGLKLTRLVQLPSSVAGDAKAYTLADGKGDDGLSAYDAMLLMQAQGYDTWALPAGLLKANGDGSRLVFVHGKAGVVPAAYALLLGASEKVPVRLPPGFSDETYFMDGSVVKLLPSAVPGALAGLDGAHLVAVPGITAKRLLIAGPGGGASALAELRQAHDQGQDVWFTADGLADPNAPKTNPAFFFLLPALRPANIVPGSMFLFLGANDAWPEGIESTGPTFASGSPTRRAIVEARALLALWMQTSSSFSRPVDATPTSFGSADRPYDLTLDAADDRFAEALGSFARWLDGSPATRQALGLDAAWTSDFAGVLIPKLLDALYLTGQGISGLLKGGQVSPPPAPAATPVDEEARAKALADGAISLYTVRKGDTPAFLARYYTGDAKRFTDLGAVNPSLGKLVKKAGLVNYANWKVGLALRLPSSWNSNRKPRPGAAPSASIK